MNKYLELQSLTFRSVGLTKRDSKLIPNCTVDIIKLCNRIIGSSRSKFDQAICVL